MERIAEKMISYIIPYLKPKRIIDVENKHTLLFEGEDNSYYWVDFSCNKIVFCSDCIEIPERKNTYLNFPSVCGLIMDHMEYENWMICATSDGCLYFINRSSNKIDNEYRICTQRLISLIVFDTLIYVLSETGKVYGVEIQDVLLKPPRGHISAIWDIMQLNGNQIVSSGADGRIHFTTKEQDKSYLAITEYGWINALEKYQEEVYFASSLGIFGKVNTCHDTIDVILDMRGKFWFNDFTIVDGYAYLGTAEGDIVEVNLMDSAFLIHKMGNEQIISIDANKNALVIASVNGRFVYVPMLENELQWDDSIAVITNTHITSISLSLDSIYISTIEGKLIQIPFTNYSKPYINARYYSVSSTRVWKVSCSGCIVCCADVDGNIYIMNSQEQRLFKVQIPAHVTSILALPYAVCYGTRTGLVDWISYGDFAQEIEIIAQEKKLAIDSQDSRSYVTNPQLGLELHYSKTLNFSGRLISFASKMHDGLTLVYHENPEEYLKEINIEWDNLPILLFNGVFLGSGFLFDEMWKCGFLLRNLKK